MNAYKSVHTGKEIDDAVTKVGNLPTKIVEQEELEVVLEDNVDVTVSGSPSSVALTIPSKIGETNLGHGYRSIVQFKSGGATPTFTCQNNSSFNLLYIQDGENVQKDDIKLLANSIVRFLAECDGLYVYLYVQQISLNTK